MSHLGPSIKRVYEKPSPDDGMRVLVDRLWPRGLSKANARVDLWLKEIAPSDALRKWFGHDPARWETFKKKYAKELAGRNDLVAALRARISEGKVTLLFAASDTEHNNAVALKAYLDATP